MKKAIAMLLVLAAAAAGANIRKTEQTLEKLEQGVIRLHIRAASDSLTDQTYKLQVRDAVLACADQWLSSAADYTAGCDAISQALPQIQSTAENALREAGCTDPVTIALRKEAFPARTYGDVTLPAGNYEALCIEIGGGKGQNWWCVMYPGLCLPAAEEDSVIAEHFSSDVREMTTDPDKYEIRLKCVDLWRALLAKIRAWEPLR